MFNFYKFSLLVIISKVVLTDGYPELLMTDLTRSRLSFTEASGFPAVVNVCIFKFCDYMTLTIKYNLLKLQSISLPYIPQG